MDADARRRRREEARRRTQRQRRIVAGATVLLAGGALGLGAILAGGSGEGDGPPRPAKPSELPRGGRVIFPRHRVVAFYGAPQARELGALGAGPPDRVGRRLERQARPYRRGGSPVLPAFELIVTIVSRSPGGDGDYSSRQPARVVERYLRAARRRKALLILDIQPGRASFMREARAFERFLVEPDVSLALDPEWSMEPGQVPGRQIGSTDAATVNRISGYLSRLIRQRRLPQKLLVVHRFTKDMIESEERLQRRPGVALTVNVDGFGDRPNKIAKYREFTRGPRRRYNGFKLFYEEDTNLMTPRQVLRLRPPPELVVYE